MASVLQYAALGAAVSLVSGSSSYAQVDAPVATINFGRVGGVIWNGINVFKGIPYGDDTSTRRFMAPFPPKPWTSVRDALKFGPHAPQTRGGGGMLG